MDILALVVFTYVVLMFYHKLFIQDNNIFRARIGKILLLLVLFVLSLVGKFMPMILGLHNVSLWLCWFVLGMVVYQYYNEVFEAIHRYHYYGHWSLYIY